ncbi:hypothetical protein ANN_10346 [Periplaneta americana]|uniref:Uncharacterized protein n=1 Tax=Periplaneta americana TaxID=6978 RepID=A0ABQ8TNR3_PERAM|nr:hypothetical protein ANN_10346 [Periplaneta americana]
MDLREWDMMVVTGFIFFSIGTDGGLIEIIVARNFYRCAENYLDISTSTDFSKSREGPFPLSSVSSCARDLPLVAWALSILRRVFPIVLLKPARSAFLRDAGHCIALAPESHMETWRF